MRLSTEDDESRPAGAARFAVCLAGGCCHSGGSHHRPSIRLAGQITAQVTENVYDMPTGGALLILQGARLTSLEVAEGPTAEVRIRARGRGLPINGRECAHDLIHARLKFRDLERLFEKG